MVCWSSWRCSNLGERAGAGWVTSPRRGRGRASDAEPCGEALCGPGGGEGFRCSLVIATVGGGAGPALRRDRPDSYPASGGRLQGLRRGGRALATSAVPLSCSNGPAIRCR